MSYWQRVTNTGSITRNHPEDQTYGRMSRYFEVNQGQTDLGVKFLSRGGGYTLFLTSTEAVFQLPVDFRLRNEEFAIGDFRLPIDRLLNNEPHGYGRLDHRPTRRKTPLSQNSVPTAGS